MVIDKLSLFKSYEWEPIRTPGWLMTLIIPTCDCEEVKKLWDKHISLKRDEAIIDKSIFPKLWKYKTQYFFNRMK